MAMVVSCFIFCVACDSLQLSTVSFAPREVSASGAESGGLAAGDRERVEAALDEVKAHMQPDRLASEGGPQCLSDTITSLESVVEQLGLEAKADALRSQFVQTIHSSDKFDVRCRMVAHGFLYGVNKAEKKKLAGVTRWFHDLAGGRCAGVGDCGTLDSDFVHSTERPGAR